MARTVSPTRTSALLPNLAAVRPVLSALMTARSYFGSVPTTVAVPRLPSVKSTVIVRLCAVATTWLLVRM
jgi:hypothetical protein